jgi:integrase
MWSRIAKLGDLPADITPHVLRHSFASLAADLGNNEPTIASLLGHKTHSITSRYMHSAGAVLLAAADAVANATMKLLGQVDIDAILSASSPSDEPDIGSVVRT